MEEAVEFLHDGRLHDLSEEGVLLSQLLGAEVLPLARRPLVVVEEVDEGCVGRLGEQLFVDICEEPREVEGGPVRGLKGEQKPLQDCLWARAGLGGLGSGAEGGPQMLLRACMRSLCPYTSAPGRLGTFSAWPVTETLPPGCPQSLKVAWSASGDLFICSPFDPPAWRIKELRHQKKQAWGETLQEGNDGNARLRAVVHLVSGLRGRDGILAVENDVFLLCFVGVRPVDLLRDGLQLLRGYGVTAVGEALWEELGEGCLRARGWPEGGQREATV